MMRALRELVEQMRARGLADHARGLAELAQVWYEAAAWLAERLDDIED